MKNNEKKKKIQYQHFNAMGRFVDTKLKSFGAKQIYRYGEGKKKKEESMQPTMCAGDDDGSMEDDFSNWIEELFESLKQSQFPDGVGKEEEKEMEIEWAYKSKFTPGRFHALQNSGEVSMLLANQPS